MTQLSPHGMRKRDTVCPSCCASCLSSSWQRTSTPKTSSSTWLTQGSPKARACHGTLRGPLLWPRRYFVRIFGVRISYIEPSFESRDMFWERSLFRHVSKLAILPQTAILTPKSCSSLCRRKTREQGRGNLYRRCLGTWQGVSRLLPDELQDFPVCHNTLSACVLEYIANDFLRSSDSLAGSTPTARF